MSDTSVQDLLAMQADQLVGIGPSQIQTLNEDDDPQLADLMVLATRIKSVLVPRRMPQRLRERLGSALTYAASVRGERSVQIASDRSPAHVILGAATVALAGGIFYLARTYLQGRSQTNSHVSS